MSMFRPRSAQCAALVAAALLAYVCVFAVLHHYHLRLSVEHGHFRVALDSDNNGGGGGGGRGRPSSRVLAAVFASEPLRGEDDNDISDADADADGKKQRSSSSSFDRHVERADADAVRRNLAAAHNNANANANANANNGEGNASNRPSAASQQSDGSARADARAPNDSSARADARTLELASPGAFVTSHYFDNVTRVSFAEPVVRSADDGVRAARAATPWRTVTAATLPSASHARENALRLAEVRAAFLDSFGAYMRTAFPNDELRPLSHASKQTFCSFAASAIDGADTLLMLDGARRAPELYATLRSYVAALDWRRTTCTASVFEFTIRFVGGLLSASALAPTADDAALFVDAARRLAERLVPAFAANDAERAQRPLPWSHVNLASGRGEIPSWLSRRVLLADVGSLQLEWHTLSTLTGDARFWRLASDVWEHLAREHTSLVAHSGGAVGAGELPAMIDFTTQRLSSSSSSSSSPSSFTMGAYADSFFEYLFKAYMLTGDDRYARRFADAIDAAERRLIKTCRAIDDSATSALLTDAQRAAYPGDAVRGMKFLVSDAPATRGLIEHLGCFLPGTLALASVHDRTVDDARRGHYLALARKLMASCTWLYTASPPHGIAPETVRWAGENTPPKRPPNGGRGAPNALRPEVLESLWWLFHVTGEQRYRDDAWRIFSAFARGRQRSDGTFASVSIDGAALDELPTWFFAETAKYLVLLFDDTLAARFSSERWVFNTEAHLMLRRDR